jgi:hypothetical protein
MRVISHTEYRAELPEGLACRGRPVVATEAGPSVYRLRTAGLPMMLPISSTQKAGQNERGR